MTPEKSTTEAEAAGASFALLERVTAAALGLVLLALGWMIGVALEPHRMRLGSANVEVIVVLGLLLLALILVSVVAMLHTD